VQLRGPWVASSYFNMPELNNKWTEDGWLRTGDVVTVNEHGYLRIVDRTKDLIKSGGEWSGLLRSSSPTNRSQSPRNWTSFSPNDLRNGNCPTPTSL
jgi:hypothetical protein